MHQAAFAATGRAACYVACDVDPGKMRQAIDGLRALGFAGANITVPLKEAAARLANRRSLAVTWTGSANTLRFGPDGIDADSTDGPGLLASLRQEAGWEPGGQRVVLLGAGGAGRAIAASMLTSGVQSLVVANRNLQRAQDLARDLSPLGQVFVCGLEGCELGPVLASAQLVVQCTSVGLGDGSASVLSAGFVAAIAPDAIVVDIVYRPERTGLLRLAQDRGLRTVGGLGMLAWQAALAWEVWFGAVGPVSIFLAAARQALEDAR